MDDSLDIGVKGDKGLQPVEIAEVYLFKHRFFACDGGDAIQHLYIRVGEVIDDKYIVTLFLQFNDCVGTDIAGTTCYQHFLFHIYKLQYVSSLILSLYMPLMSTSMP